MAKIKNFITDLTRRYSSRAFMSVCISVWMFDKHPEHFGGWNLVAILTVFMGFNAVDNYVKIKKAGSPEPEQPPTEGKINAK